VPVVSWLELARGLRELKTGYDGCSSRSDVVGWCGRLMFWFEAGLGLSMLMLGCLNCGRCDASDCFQPRINSYEIKTRLTTIKGTISSSAYFPQPPLPLPIPLVRSSPLPAPLFIIKTRKHVPLVTIRILLINPTTLIFKLSSLALCPPKEGSDCKCARPQPMRARKRSSLSTATALRRRTEM
jgi:hypothetical protein